MMKKIFGSVFICIAVFSFAALARTASAANLDYGTIVDFEGNSVLVKYKGIGTENYYLCTISPLACAPTASTTAIKHPAVNSASTNRTRGLSQAASPDLRYIATFNASTASRPERTFTINDTKTAKLYTYKSATGYWDLLSEGITNFSFSPDGKKLVYLDDVSGNQTLYMVDLTKLTGTSFKGTQLFTRKYDVIDFIFWDADTIYYTANRDNPYDWALYKFSIKNQTATKVADNTSYNASMKKSGDYILFMQIGKDSIDPVAYNTRTGTLSKFPIALPNVPFLKTGSDEVVSFGADHGVLMKPVTPAPGAPLLVWLHGGPFRQSSLDYHSYFSYGGYDWILEQLRNKGVTVLKLDYPGSFGFGRAYAESLKDNVGVKDVQAVYNAANAIKTRIGSTNVSLVGNSYGGYLALRTLMGTPSAFAGAFSINGVTDWQLLHERIPSSIFTLHFGGPETLANLSRYNNASIFNLIERLGNQRIVLTHGNADTDIPYWQSQTLADTLKGLNKNVDFITYDGENHIYAKPATFTDLCKQMFKFENLDPGASCEIK